MGTKLMKLGKSIVIWSSIFDNAIFTLKKPYKYEDSGGEGVKIVKYSRYILFRQYYEFPFDLNTHCANKIEKILRQVSVETRKLQTN